MTPPTGNAAPSQRITFSNRPIHCIFTPALIASPSVPGARVNGDSLWERIAAHRHELSPAGGQSIMRAKTGRIRPPPAPRAGGKPPKQEQERAPSVLGNRPFARILHSGGPAFRRRPGGSRYPLPGQHLQTTPVPQIHLRSRSRATGLEPVTFGSVGQSSLHNMFYHGDL